MYLFGSKKEFKYLVFSIYLRTGVCCVWFVHVSMTSWY